MDGVLNENLETSLRSYLELCGSVGADVDLVKKVATASVAKYGKKHVNPDDAELLKAIEDRWYDSVDRGEPDYDVYADDSYLGELWACWAVYSRKSLRQIRSSDGMLGKSFGEDAGDVGVVVDLGCGVGYTTAVLKEMFPSAEVYGTNLLDTVQGRLAEVMGDRYGFRMISGVDDVKEVKVDLVFASEYFEHFEFPMDHLDRVMVLRPRILWTANSFGGRAVGHFDLYKIRSGGLSPLCLTVSGREASRRFNAELRRRGYKMKKTSMWNNRPACWNKNDAAKEGSS